MSNHPNLMKTSLLTCFSLLASLQFAAAQTTVLYQQDFGTTNGGTTLAAVGWSQVLVPSGYSGIYNVAGAHDGTTSQALPTHTLYFGGNAGTGIFHTTNGAGSGTGGDSAFTSIDPTHYTNLNISVESQWSYQGANLKCWFAVQVGGGWYVSTNHPITTQQQSAGNTFYLTGMTYSPSATNWNYLTNSATVAIGGPVSGDLSGQITGVGIVAALIGSGSWDYNNLLITSISNTVTLPPILVAPPLSQTAYVGAGVSFAVSASGTAPFTYQWWSNGVPIVNGGRISGANNSVLTIMNITAADSGTSYSVIVSNSGGCFDTSTNSTATLTVNAVPPDYLYAETFPFVGPLAIGYPLSMVGWSNSVPDNPNRLYQNAVGDGAAFAYQGSAMTNVFYVTTNSDSGFAGLPFPKIIPAAYPAVSFSVDIAPSYQPANVTAYFAVQMDTGSWFVNSTPIPVDTSTATTTFATYQQQFTSLAAQWRSLTINSATASIGGPAGSNLSGNITGAGLVFVYSGAGNFNIDNFLVITDAVQAASPTITWVPQSQTVYTGGGVSFAVYATGDQPLTYYWQMNGNPLANGGRISGATSNVITILNAGTNDQGQYSVIVSNSAGTDNSANYVTTLLTVNDPPVGLLYAETFPYVGPGSGGGPVSLVGWGNAIPNNPDRLFQIVSGEGAAYAYQDSAATTAFFGATTLDTGVSGLAFPNVTLAWHSNITFSVDIAPTTTPANVSAAIIVQMNGGSWYVSSTNLPVDTSAETATYSTYTQVFTPIAANWKNLTLTAGSGATVGGTPSNDLSGSITGAGLVFNYVGSGGTFNMDNFLITGTGIGGITLGAISNATLALSWDRNPKSTPAKHDQPDPANCLAGLGEYHGAEFRRSAHDRAKDVLPPHPAMTRRFGQENCPCKSANAPFPNQPVFDRKEPTIWPRRTQNLIRSFRKRQNLTMKILLSIASVISVLALAGLPAHANLLSNGDFNTGDLTGWWTYAADPSQTVSIDNTYTYDGSPNAAMASASSTWRNALGQDFTVLPNTTYSVSFAYSAAATPTWGSAALSITYYDSSWAYANGFVWAPLYDQSPAPNADGQWLTYSGTFTTTANTANLDFEFDAWNWTTFHVDNVDVELVPEPSTAALLSAAGLALVLFRRRA